MYGNFVKFSLCPDKKLPRGLKKIESGEGMGILEKIEGMEGGL